MYKKSNTLWTICFSNCSGISSSLKCGGFSSSSTCVATSFSRKNLHVPAKTTRCAGKRCPWIQMKMSQFSSFMRMSWKLRKAFVTWELDTKQFSFDTVVVFAEPRFRCKVMAMVTLSLNIFVFFSGYDVKMKTINDLENILLLFVFKPANSFTN